MEGYNAVVSASAWDALNLKLSQDHPRWEPQRIAPLGIGKGRASSF
jgi:hypothetical protein